MKPWSHWRSGIAWGFGTIWKPTGQRTAEGTFCYLVQYEDGLIVRYCCGKGYPETGMDYLGASAWSLGRHA